ncbi:double-strand break repair helicase AddA [Ferrovibrio sp.]|uniref:double-strand break repair helicase AddA n=1 Tax=Ferrovibrio sp. TaxID=1917215 RepID=UPI000CB2CFC6|nr:double-strand break repair helicase AddA [Ferrovibrio sp.]PJI42014.1 MAG: double-strand break repair helicase AddA [Ferrovibrio sp.]
MRSDPELLTHTMNQRSAADPAQSAWVAANAGSGKTRVLVDRVTRLLLMGTRPSGILCLTFTKAAAAEMQLRLTDRLGKWTMLNDAELKAELFELLGRPVTESDMDAARRLFARTLESPGGLRLQTVHAFCEALLKRFPVEAQVPPGFAVADEAVTADLFETARRRVLGDGLSDADFRPVIDFFAARVDDGRFADLLKALLGRRRDLALLLEAHDGAAGAISALYAQLELPPDATRDLSIRLHIDAMRLADLRRAAAALCGGSVTDRKIGQPLADWLAAGLPVEQFEDVWFAGFFTGEGKPRARMATKTAIAAAADCADILAEEQARLIALQQELNKLTVAEATAMLLRLGEQLLKTYAKLKTAQGLLDYDDLILRTRDLLVEPSQVPWVMFKLDRGIDHILVDEAQDTSPDQWSVVAALAEEFFSGTGARDDIPRRTIFAVGDVKQSIYSFQGARPQAFLDTYNDFRRRAEAVDQRLAQIPLEMSFRSAPAVLQLVDAVFAEDAAKPGVVGEKPLHHKASRSDAAGRIELWPPFRPDPKAQSEPWEAPLDYVGQKDPRKRLAEEIAAQIRRWMDDEELLPGLGRHVQPGDVMILVRRRNVFFEAMVQALKTAGVPVAGADRMKLAEQIAVLDLLALGGFCLLPEDDLTLATVLKGPLFNFSEEDLFDLCWNRQQPRVWHELRRRAEERPLWRAASDELHRWLARADLVTPFTLYAELLGAGDGRRRLVARLGPQANEPIDEFIAATLAYERENAPSLQGFLSWFPRHAGEVKRDLDQGRNEVRVLTVHGAKGLEAPIVILPDTCDLPQDQGGGGLLWGEAPTPGMRTPGPAAARAVPQLYWPMRKDNDTAVTAGLRGKRHDEQMEEYRRLLYVALTRARDRLYVCGYLGVRNAEKGPPQGSWYDLVAAGFDHLPSVQSIALPWGDEARRYETNPDSRSEAKPAVAATEIFIAPDWLRQPAPPEPTPPRPLSPSQPSRPDPAPLSPTTAKNQDGLKRGRLVHRLLQTLPDLPDAERAAAAARFLAHPGHALDPAAQAILLKEVMALLGDPQFAALFRPGARTEAPLAGRIGNRTVVGQVDRLLIDHDTVLVVDYKTNRPPPSAVTEVDPAYLDQMALYRGLLAQVFPNRRIEAALVWTHTAHLMPLPNDLLDQRLAAFTAT